MCQWACHTAEAHGGESFEFIESVAQSGRLFIAFRARGRLHLRAQQSAQLAAVATEKGTQRLDLSRIGAIGGDSHTGGETASNLAKEAGARERASLRTDLDRTGPYGEESLGESQDAARFGGGAIGPVELAGVARTPGDLKGRKGGNGQP
jgi:hypothetical protein